MEERDARAPKEEKISWFEATETPVGPRENETKTRTRTQGGREQGKRKRVRGRGREKEQGERPRNLRFHLVARACPSRFSSSPGLHGWGPVDGGPVDGGPVRQGHLPAQGAPSPFPHPVPSLFALPSSSTARQREEATVVGTAPRGLTLQDTAALTPSQANAPLYSILALCFSSPVILANDYAVRISVGPPGISENDPVLRWTDFT